jgi:PTH1 family peptidyl-tRNA hydrolase
MKIIVGLGNPGKKYEQTRHNVGFLALDFFLLRNDGFSSWRLKKEEKTKIAEGKIGDEKIILVKPQTFMNQSGEAVKEILKRKKEKIENLLVVHDDLDLPFGKIRLSFGASSAGHKGVQSIINLLESQDFWRLRIGIGPKIKPAEQFVLAPFSKKEQNVLKEILVKVTEAIKLGLKEPEKAMTLYNR